MLIRVLNRSEDAAAFRAIRIESVQDSPESFRLSSEEINKMPIKDFENELVENDGNRTFVGAFEEDELVGVGALYLEPYQKLAHKGAIGSVFVKPEFRKRGIAKELLDKIIQIAKDTGTIEHINLTVVSSNTPAIRLYENLGFVIYGTEPNVVKVDGKYFDEYLMQLIL